MPSGYSSSGCPLTIVGKDPPLRGARNPTKANTSKCGIFGSLQRHWRHSADPEFRHHALDGMAHMVAVNYKTKQPIAPGA